MVHSSPLYKNTLSMQALNTRIFCLFGSFLSSNTSFSLLYLHITLMDMSKAFDTVQRNTLLKDLSLRQILTPAELHIIKILIQDIKLKVRIGKETSDDFTTKMGVPQGDCLSPILFTLYLAKALKETNTSQNRDHTYHQSNTDKKMTTYQHGCKITHTPNKRTLDSS